MADDANDLETTPNFSRNRDLTDVAYEKGWNDGRAGATFDPGYQKASLRIAYHSGYRAAQHGTGDTP